MAPFVAPLVPSTAAASSNPAGVAPASGTGAPNTPIMRHSTEATRRIMRELKRLRQATALTVYLAYEADLYTWRVNLVFGPESTLGEE